MTDSLRDQYASSPLYGGNAPFVEALYESFLLDPESVGLEWREYFTRLKAGAGNEIPHGPIIAELPAAGEGDAVRGLHGQPRGERASRAPFRA